MKKCITLLSVWLAFAGFTAASVQNDPVTLTEVTGTPADGNYVVKVSSSSGSGYLYTDQDFLDRPFRVDVNATFGETLDPGTQLKYVWELANGDDGTFTLRHRNTGRNIPADPQHNQNCTGSTTAANLALVEATGATDGLWYVYQTDHTGTASAGGGDARLFIHTNKVNETYGPNLSYWEGSSATGTSIRIRLYKVNGDLPAAPEPGVYAGPDVFKYMPGGIVYRIPAIAKAHNGDLIAVADYRHSGADIGMAKNGRIDLHARISKDNGTTWGDVFPIVEGMGANSPDSMHVAFGDPCIVADRESDKVLVMSCSGNISFPSGSRNNHQGIARFVSNDNGATWSEPVDISGHIYAQFDNSDYVARAMFVGSGKILQSSTVKVGDYYRLYCALDFSSTTSSGYNINFVLYSDNFGETWKILGTADTPPISNGGDEPKVEELPDGSIVLSSRPSSTATGGRIYNIFHFTNTAKAEGSWGTMAVSNASNHGTVSDNCSCNGEILVVPAVRKADGKKLYVALQSVPFGPGRVNVGIHYKELASLADFNTPANFAKDWDGSYQVSKIGSGYSTMTRQANDSIAFLYEEETYGVCYTVRYKGLSLETITGGAYGMAGAEDLNPMEFVKESIDFRVNELIATESQPVGSPVLDEEAVAAINAAVAQFTENPTKENYENITVVAQRMVEEGKFDALLLEEGQYYTIRNVGRPGYLQPQTSTRSGATVNTFGAAGRTATNANQVFTFQRNGDGNWTIFNPNYDTYISTTKGREVMMPQVAEADAGVFVIESNTNGISTFVATAPELESQPAVNLTTDQLAIVSWVTSDEASQWYIEPVTAQEISVPESGYVTLNLPYAVVIPEGVTAYAGGSLVTVDGVRSFRLEVMEEEVVLAGTPVILSAAPGTYSLPIFPFNVGRPVNSSLTGVLAPKTVEGGGVFVLDGSKFVKRTATTGTIAANTAYYVCDEDVTELPLTLDAGSTDGIGSVTTDAQAAEYFDLSGRRVLRPAKGVFVTSEGRKVILK